MNSGRRAIVGAFTNAGRTPARTIAAAVLAALGPGAWRHDDEDALAAEIYERVQLRRPLLRSIGLNAPRFARPGARFLAALAGRCHVAGGFERLGDGLARHRGGLRVTYAASDLAAVKGRELYLRVPVVRRIATPGFVGAVGTRGPLTAGSRVWRVYCAVLPSAADRAALALWRRLDAARLRFELKLLSEAAEYPRADALVAFVLEDDLARALTAAVELSRSGLLAEPAAGLAVSVAPGVAFAPERSATAPPEGTAGDRQNERPRTASYGAWMATIAASALVAARGSDDAEQRLSRAIDSALACRDRESWSAAGAAAGGVLAAL
ncbi:hypothetical protein SAMN02745716_1039 [Thermoleophilum album]|uniref:Uncharacterized protein n=1 Tax=Thermoleophilum album TaxID=29539 RepID=A0A1H6FN09_THEAL|nr:hypothetical protein SAMN02745716_1039 [Thermoleophilum album]